MYFVFVLKGVSHIEAHWEYLNKKFLVWALQI